MYLSPRHTQCDWILHIFHFHDVAKQDVTPCLRFAVVKVIRIEHNARRIDDLDPALKLHCLQFLRMAWLCSDSTDLVHPNHHACSPIHLLCVLRTLDLLSELIRLLFPTFGNPTTPMVMLCAALGLYAFRRRMSAGTVGEDKLER